MSGFTHLPHIAVIIAFSTFTLGTACSGIRQLDVRTGPVFALADIKSNGELLSQHLKAGKGPFTVHLSKGDEVAVKLALDVPGVVLVPGPTFLRLERDLWAYFDGKKLYLSPDAQNWAPIQDTRALHKLFGLGRGSFQVGMGASAEEGAVLTARAALQSR